MPSADPPRRGAICSMICGSPRPRVCRAGRPSRRSPCRDACRGRQRRPIDVEVRLVDDADSRLAPPTAVSRAAAGTRSANRPESGTGARSAGTSGRSPCVEPPEPDVTPSAAARMPPTIRSRPCSKTRASRVRSSSSSSSRLQRIDVDRQPPLVPHVIPNVLVSGDHVRSGPRRAVGSAVMKRFASASRWP